MSTRGRLARYLERLLSALRAYGELQGKIAESIRTGATDALALQADLDRGAAAEIDQLAHSILALRAPERGGPATAAAALQELQQRIERERAAALEANLRNRRQLSGALQELRAKIQELKGSPRPVPSPFSRIGEPTLIDFHT
jgi:hypothetical protein